MVAENPSAKDSAFQDRILQGVSRTFALTIPTLPPPLYLAVANAYLLCRIADTIEDDADFSFELKHEYSQQFVDILRGSGNIESFKALSDKLASHALPAERELLANTDAVVRITHSLNENQQRALIKCVRTMADGMMYYQGQETLDGLPDQAAMDRYCYYVAGVVGEMLTELFCDYVPELEDQKPHLMRLAVSFGQGLQMTNILKDIWDDRQRGACWLPRDAFEARNIKLRNIQPGHGGDDFADAMGQLIATAHGHVQNALEYTLQIPRREAGIRKFCLWALGMAVLTLRKINSNRNYSNGNEVKISRNSVKATVISTNLFVRSNLSLKLLFSLASTGLPKRHVNATAPNILDKSESSVV
ncbi:MAG: phytoene/squalene synthase family protein [Gammaproteobacteria bacterium]